MANTANNSSKNARHSFDPLNRGVLRLCVQDSERGEAATRRVRGSGGSRGPRRARRARRGHPRVREAERVQLRQVARDRAEEARPQRGVGVDVALGELGALHEVDDEALRRQVVQPRPEPLGRRARVAHPAHRRREPQPRERREELGDDRAGRRGVVDAVHPVAEARRQLGDRAVLRQPRARQQPRERLALRQLLRRLPAERGDDLRVVTKDSTARQWRRAAMRRAGVRQGDEAAIIVLLCEFVSLAE